jgi:hypothetical protein
MSYLHVTLHIHVKTHIGLHAEGPSAKSHFNQNWTIKKQKSKAARFEIHIIHHYPQCGDWQKLGNSNRMQAIS